MPLQEETSSPLLGQCVIILFRDFEIDGNTSIIPPPNLKGNLTLETKSSSPVVDPNGAIFGNKIQTFNDSDWTTCNINGANYWAIKTIALPANYDRSYLNGLNTVSRALEPSGSTYKVHLQVANQKYEMIFQIDASTVYTDHENCDCINLERVKIETIEGAGVCCSTSEQNTIANLIAGS